MLSTQNHTKLDTLALIYFKMPLGQIDPIILFFCSKFLEDRWGDYEVIEGSFGNLCFII